MEDSKIVALYWERAETAIGETAKKYGSYCRTVAWNILYSHEDSEECVNDTYLSAWHSMPPQRPERLRAYLGRITRNLALDRYKFNRTEKRGGGRILLALEELEECVPSGDPERITEDLVLTEALNRFLADLPQEARKIFLQRYWYLCSVREIADDLHISESKVKMTLLRSRNQLRALLEKEGIGI